MTNVISLYAFSALILPQNFVFYFPTILNYLQQEYNTLKWKVNRLVTLPSQCRIPNNLSISLIFINETFTKSRPNILQYSYGCIRMVFDQESLKINLLRLLQR